MNQYDQMNPIEWDKTHHPTAVLKFGVTPKSGRAFS